MGDHKQDDGALQLWWHVQGDGMMSCIKTTSSSWLIEGSPTTIVKDQHGVRQGDPMSPLIISDGERISGTLIEMNRLKPRSLRKFELTWMRTWMMPRMQNWRIHQIFRKITAKANCLKGDTNRNVLGSSQPAWKIVCPNWRSVWFQLNPFSFHSSQLVKSYIELAKLVTYVVTK